MANTNTNSLTLIFIFSIIVLGVASTTEIDDWVALFRILEEQIVLVWGYFWNKTTSSENIIVFEGMHTHMILGLNFGKKKT